MTHLTLEELVDVARGAPVGAGRTLQAHVLRHLEACELCRVESRRWSVVADGVRHRSVAAGPVEPPVRRSRRTVLAPVAAAVAMVLVAVSAYALGVVLDRPAGKPAPIAGSTPTQCRSLKVAAGTLEGVGARRSVRTAEGHSIPLEASASTGITRLRGGPPRAGDITVGAHVVVSGASDPAAPSRLQARHVVVLPGPVELPRDDSGLDVGRILADSGVALGTVGDVEKGGFTVRGPGGAHVRVATGRTTSVVAHEAVGLRALEAGAYTVAVGTPGPDGTLRAAAIQQKTLSSKGILLALPSSAVGCAPSAIATGALLASGR